MSLTSLLVHDITILTSGSRTTRADDAVKDWRNATETTVSGWFSQVGAFEDLDGREAKVTDAVLFLPADTTITAADRVRYGGVTYEITGRPHRAATPVGIHHIEVNLRAVEG